MYTELLIELGLKRNEAKIYEALLKYGGSGASTIAIRSKLNRRTVYDTMERLVNKGLVYEVFGEKETTYEAVDPTKLMELLQEKEDKLASALPEMLRSFQSKAAVERAYIFKGLEGVKNYVRMTLQEGDDVLTLGGTGCWLDPRMHMFMEWYLKEAQKKGMTYYNLFDHEVQKEFADAPERLSVECKFLPPEASSNTGIDIFGKYVVTSAGWEVGKWSDDLTIFVLASPDLADGYRKWFWMIWNLLPGPKGPMKNIKKKKCAP
ncbi:hypothetical protein COU76_02510 [Candidatus Peregrinibacteria bacterium CG10_big_fil_rev_8_21_14_0_10_49_10]|nr:MAG: hypothetical protein COU76_02510 [Candidatus Peregrinibacteria bacterium CG10_big_fil_rev_8_21_14_0_10_49_10]